MRPNKNHRYNNKCLFLIQRNNHLFIIGLILVNFLYAFIANIFYEPNPNVVLRTAGNLDIDVVYTWVNGTDPHWQHIKSLKEKEYNVTIKKNVNAGRFIDFEEIRYSLRSVFKNIPWVHKVYIITDNQTISYLSEDPRIVYVDHRTIFPPDALPTYNSNAIEFCIMNIPGLSNQFLYANDDFFFARPSTKDVFFEPNGNPKIPTHKSKWPNATKSFKEMSKSKYRDNFGAQQYNTVLKRTASVFETKIGRDAHGSAPHSIFPCSLKLCRKAYEIFGKEIDEVRHHHFRSYTDMLFQLLMVFTCDLDPSLCTKTSPSGYARFLQLHGKKENSPFKDFDPSKVVTFCVNSDSATTDELRLIAKEWLENWMNEPLSIEKDRKK
ncbi:Capsular polysaccharide phosphotransferase fcs1 [Histomonas meleagridis]|uniref:Capsular polysaccharide phosphotransferase fcs1 n=1 Tax=Histomonas meleagridis TaxID=135588 RepID=UPI003559FDB2|nr:Capsular polysaccharide phosphotransferase fcs1 [Histomonas meleagridis]KAH0802974.1 Capsular polysaccharide phosphotransferase fcs1 [Histomonas meleagridis]